MYEWVLQILAIIDLGDQHSHVSREITNGVWFLLNIYVLFYLGRLLWYNILWKNRPIWHQPDHIKLAWGMSLILIGSTIRAGWIWLLLIAEEANWYNAQETINEITLFTYIAIIFAMWGSTCIAKLFQSQSRSTARQFWHVAVVGFVALFIPILIHLLVS